MGWSQDLFRFLWRSLSREVKEHVGTDQFGNNYYYIAGYKNWRGEVRARAVIVWSVILD
uniref:NADH dehydrogenase [ubiquinone] 1 alpha subcomplex assembly factor 2 n=1 Tax=Aotus nancymaae TaxID=37293 RepID=A0A2K5EZY1_AOTNA